jgi:Zn-dependent M16 (insulinase) family peptidase
MHRLFSCLLFMTIASAQPAAPSFSSLAEGQIIDGFRAVSAYLDNAGRAMGARFIHQRSGFTLDLLEIQSAPQGFVWVTTYPTSNMGEPHTQEHLLVGKGSKGRALGGMDRMWLMTTNAFTEQWRTCYDFSTTAGPEVFYQYFEKYMDALLHPDYTDEEVHREVRNFGVVSNPAEGILRLEEKGSVYNEMVSSMDQAGPRLFRAASLAIYGPEHPLSFSSGGLPEALRMIQPSDIRRFHDSHYFLANMGMIASLPKDMPLASSLARFNAALGRLEPVRPSLPVMREEQLPAPQPAQAGRIEYVEYPFRNDQQSGSVVVLWPADRTLAPEDVTLLNLFLGNVGGGPDTNLYKRLVDSKTREYDFGIKGVYATADSDQGHPVYVMLQDVPVAHMNDKDLATVRATILDEFARIAAYSDGSPQLAGFNQRLKGRIEEQRRDLSKFVNSPPGFGLRNTYGAWVAHLYDLNKRPGFRKSLTGKDELAAIEQLIGGSHNIWRERLAQWKIVDANPYIAAAKPNPALATQEISERVERATAEIARLKEKYGVDTAPEAIRRYQQEYDAASAALEKVAAEAPHPGFVNTPPLTLDDQLDFQTIKLLGDIPLVSSTFESMTGATTGLALRLDAIPEDRLVFVSLLPALLTRVGVIENGKPVSFEEMTQRLRTEILSLNASFSSNELSDRTELVARGAGNDVAEAKRALEWMNLALLHPDWRPENLPRIRDLVDQALAQLRTTMQNSEESWVNPVAVAYRKQANPVWLATNSFLSRIHNAHRLRWMLKDGGDDAVYAFLADLGKAPGTRDDRSKLLAAIRDGQHPAMEKLTPAENALVKDAARDLLATLPDIPDSSLSADWRYLCAEMVRDLRTGPRAALAQLDEVRRSILKTGGARLFLISSTATRQALDPGIHELAGALELGAVKKAAYRPGRRIDARLAARETQAAHPVFVGLLNPNSQGGVFLNSAPFVTYHDTSREKLLDYAAANLYGGGGAHSIFSKTIAAGLAYSNGLGAGPAMGRISYYAERTPELSQTLQFVIGELQKAKPDPALVDYAIAGAFAVTRAANSYESRGESMADDLADGVTPEVVSRFRRAILDVRKSPDLGSELFRRMLPAYSKVLPGLGGKSATVAGGEYFVIGPEKQFVAYEQYLKRAEGPATRLWRLYPRDFWLTAE